MAPKPKSDNQNEEKDQPEGWPVGLVKPKFLRYDVA
jgi:hypothetical protein